MPNATQNHFGRSVVTGLTALGSSQTTGFALLNNADHHFTTVAASTGATLPPGKIPSSVTVFNDGASSLAVYPPVGGTINGGTVNAPVTVGTLTGVQLFAAGMLTWYTVAAAGGGAATTGLVITQHSGLVSIDVPVSGAVTCDFSASDRHSVTMAVSTTITLVNPTNDQVVRLSIIQGGSGTLTPTFSPVLDWGTAGAPAWSTAVGKEDIIVLTWNGTKYRAALYGTGF